MHVRAPTLGRRGGRRGNHASLHLRGREHIALGVCDAVFLQPVLRKLRHVQRGTSGHHCRRCLNRSLEHRLRFGPDLLPHERLRGDVKRGVEATLKRVGENLQKVCVATLADDGD